MENEDLKKVLGFFKKEKLNEEEEHWKTVHEFEINDFKFLPVKGIQIDFKDNIRIPNEDKYDEVYYIETWKNEEHRFLVFENMITSNAWIDDERVYKNNETIHFNIDRDVFNKRIKLNSIDFGPKRSGYKFTVKINSLDLQAKD